MIKYTMTDDYGGRHEVEGKAAERCAEMDVEGMFDSLDVAADRAIWRMFKWGMLVGVSAAAAVIMAALAIAQYIYV